MEGRARGRSGHGGRGREGKEAPGERRKEGEAGGGVGERRRKERVLGQVGEGGMRARWTRCRALRRESALKGETLGGRFWPGAEPGKEGGWVCACPSLPEAAVFESGFRGWGYACPALRFQARRGKSWPKESDSGTIRNSRRPGAFG